MIAREWAASRWRNVAGIFATAVLLALYARGGAGWVLGFVALVPWLLTLDGVRTVRGALSSGVAMSAAFVAAAFAWFGAAIGAYTGIGGVAATAVLVALAPVLQPQVWAFALVRHAVGRRHGPVPRALAGAAAWVAVEWLVPKLLGDTLGHGLFPSQVLRQGADLGGAAGLTFALILVNEAVALAIARRRDGLRASMKPVIASVALVACMAGYGAMRLSALQAPPAQDAPMLRIAMVQTSITDYERLRREIGAYGVVRKVLDTHYALSWSALRDHRADALLWSETVYPTTFGHPRSADGAALDAEIQGFVDAARVPLVFGSYDLDADGEYNAAVFLEPGKGRLGTYRKTHPFPLTEYVPRWLDGPWLRGALPWAGTWRPGDGARVLPLRTADGREVNVVPLICLDDVRPQLAIDGARLGAQAIVGMSNDAWFTDYPLGARLHLAVAAFRSVETRLPQARVTTNGLSAIIDDTGEVLARTAMGDQAVLTAYVSARDPAPTLMVRWGDWVGRTCAVLLAAFAVIAGWRAWRARARGALLADANAAVQDVLVLAWPSRIAIGVLRIGAAIGLAWLALDMLLRIGWQVQSLSQLKLFGMVVVAPLLAAWALARAHAAQARIEGALLVLDQRRRRIEIPVASIAALHPWRMPLPSSGVDLTLDTQTRWTHGLAVLKPLTLSRALAASGAPARIEGRFANLIATLAETRAMARHRVLDHPLLKFALFPLLPALVAFRLHQVIAFGGPFGEWHTYGAGAWLTGLAIWWASWSIGLMLFAAAMRIVIEAVCVAALLARPSRGADVRDVLEMLARAAFYIGVPAWLGWRLLSA